MKTKAQRRFPDSIRFNWGYWDAKNDKQNHFVPVWHRGPVDKHFDKAYVEGYYRGMNEQEGA